MKLPNVLTLLRIAMIPLFIFLFFSDLNGNYTYAFIVFFIAGITDILDGYIARRFDMVTDAGKVLDPLADKLMLMTVLICLASTNMVPLWLIVVMIIKELTMVYGGIRLYFSKTQIIIPSNKFGKMATVLFYIAICLVLLNVDHIIATLILYIAVGLALYAFFNYIRIAIKTKNKEN